jgi:hypothetical protein
VHFLLELQFEYPLQWVSGDVFIQLQLKTIKIMKKNVLFKKILSEAMRITLTQLLLSFVFCGITLANDAFSQEVLNKSISLKPETITVKRALTQIERLADVKFIYSPNLIQSERKVNLSFDNNRLSTILNEFLTPLNISYEVVGNRIVLSKRK